MSGACHPLSSLYRQRGEWSGLRCSSTRPPCPPAHQAVCPLSPAPEASSRRLCQAAHLGSHAIKDQHSTWYRAGPPQTEVAPLTPHSPHSATLPLPTPCLPQPAPSMLLTLPLPPGRPVVLQCELECFLLPASHQPEPPLLPTVQNLDSVLVFSKACL